MFGRTLRYFEQSPMKKSRECKMQNFIAFLIMLLIFENFENFLWARGNPKHNKLSRGNPNFRMIHGDLFIWKSFHHSSEMSFQGTFVAQLLFLAGYAQSSLPGELR